MLVAPAICKRKAELSYGFKVVRCSWFRIRIEIGRCECDMVIWDICANLALALQILLHHLSKTCNINIRVRYLS